MFNNEQDFSFKQFFTPLTTKKAILIIAVVSFIVFFDMLFNGFVWDDKTYIIWNNEVHTFNILKLIGLNTFNVGGQYRPFPAIYFAVLYSLFHELPFFYHLIQLMLHITNAILVFLVFVRFFKKKISLFLSLIFLIHPTQVESVPYISSSDNPLFFLFGMLALLLSLKDTISLKRVFAISCCLLLSLYAKETGVLFLFIILLHRIIFKKNNIFVFCASEMAVFTAYILTGCSIYLGKDCIGIIIF